MLEIDEFKDRYWKNENGYFHREEGPAIEWSNGSKEWWLKGERHREDGPAYEGIEGNRFWYRNGKLHRIDGPAMERNDGRKKWWLNGKEYTETEYRKNVGEIC